MATATNEPLLHYSLSPLQHPNLPRPLINKLAMTRQASLEDDDGDHEEEESEPETHCTRFARSPLQHAELHGAATKRVESNIEEGADKDVEGNSPRYYRSPLQRLKLHRSLMQSLERKNEDEASPPSYRWPSHQKLGRTFTKEVAVKNEDKEDEEVVNASVHFQQSPLKQDLHLSLTEKVEKELEEGRERNCSARSHHQPLQKKLRQKKKAEVEEDDDDKEDDDEDAPRTEEIQKLISHSRPRQHHQTSAESSSSSDGEYSRPRIREDLLPHDFLAWRRSSPSSSTLANKSVSIHPPPPPPPPPLPSTSFSASLNRNSVQEQKQAYSPLKSHSYHLQRASRSPGSARMTVLPRSSSSDLFVTKARRNLSDLKLDQHRFPSFSSSSSSSSSSSFQRPQNPSFSGGKEKDTLFFRETDAETQLRELSQETEKNPKESQNEVYQNLVEMFPLIRSLMETSEDGNKGNFQHHAAMVYTRAPSRDELSKKVANWKRDMKNCRRKHSTDEPLSEAQKSSLVRRATIEDPSSRRVFNNENRMEIVKLQDQVVELKSRLAAREGMLAICYQQAKQDSDGNTEITRLSSRIEELEQQLAEKDLHWASAKELLQRKENEIDRLRKLVCNSEEMCTSLTKRNMSNEKELKVLRCEIAALRWQMEIQTLSHDQALEDSLDDSVSQVDVVGSRDKESDDVSQTEVVRKMYYAAIIIARIVPNDECLVLVQLLRIQIQHILQNPTFGFELNLVGRS